MRFFHTLTTFVLGIAIGVQADYKTVNTDISNLSAALAVLDADVKLVQAGAVGVARALQVQVDAVAIHKILLQGIADANASPNFGINSPSVSVAVIQLQPNVSNTLKDLQNQQPALGDLGAVVLSSLYQLKKDTDTFGAAVVKKLEPLEAGVAPAIIKMFDDSFNSAIVAFGGKGKRTPICLIDQ